MARTQYLEELESVRQNLIQMGETTLALLTEAILTVSRRDSGSVERASELEAKTDHQHRLIHDQCLRLIALQAPVARDARLVTGILDAIVDLELIGDYAYEIVTLSGSMEHRPPQPIMAEISGIGSKTREALSTALEGWRSEESARTLSVKTQAVAIRAECQMLGGKLSQLTSLPGYALPCVNLMLICRQLERISRHAACVAEQAAGTAPAAGADPLSNSH
jgi:phosphate transport system protein